MGRVLAIVVLFLLVSPKSVLADVKVDISGNGEGSESTVSVESNIHSKTTSGKNSTNKTDIRLETNGEVKEYHGNDESVRIESGNGNNSVSINEDVSGDDNEKVDGIDEIEDEDSSASASLSAQVNDGSGDDKQFNLLEFIKERINSILSFFKS